MRWSRRDRRRHHPRDNSIGNIVVSILLLLDTLLFYGLPPLLLPLPLPLLLLSTHTHTHDPYV